MSFFHLQLHHKVPKSRFLLFVIAGLIWLYQDAFWPIGSQVDDAIAKYMCKPSRRF